MTLWTVEFSRPEHWNGKPFPSPGDLPNPGIEPRSPALHAESLPLQVSSNVLETPRGLGPPVPWTGPRQQQIRGHSQAGRGEGPRGARHSEPTPRGCWPLGLWRSPPCGYTGSREGLPALFAWVLQTVVSRYRPCFIPGPAPGMTVPATVRGQGPPKCSVGTRPTGGPQGSCSHSPRREARTRQTAPGPASPGIGCTLPPGAEQRKLPGQEGT